MRSLRARMRRAQRKKVRVMDNEADESLRQAETCKMRNYVI